MALTDSDGNLIETYEYDVFGIPDITQNGATNNRFLFAGYGWDAGTGLYNYSDVAYDPVIGCLVQEDQSVFYDYFPQPCRKCLVVVFKYVNDAPVAPAGQPQQVATNKMLEGSAKALAQREDCDGPAVVTDWNHMYYQIFTEAHLNPSGKVKNSQEMTPWWEVLQYQHIYFLGHGSGGYLTVPERFSNPAKDTEITFTEVRKFVSKWRDFLCPSYVLTPSSGPRSVTFYSCKSGEPTGFGSGSSFISLVANELGRTRNSPYSGVKVKGFKSLPEDKWPQEPQGGWTSDTGAIVVGENTPPLPGQRTKEVSAEVP